MNYFELHVGDYESATAHLSLIEDGVYCRLLRVCYRTEQPIPADLKQACRLVRAASKAERDVVRDILSEFFELRDDGWHNTRCDEEISRYQDKQRKARASAEARWSQRDPHVGRNANAYANAPPDAMRTHSEGNATRTRAPTRAPARPQSPDTKHYADADASAPSVASPKAPRASKRCPPDFEVTPEMVAWAATACPGVSVSQETAKLRDHTFKTARSDWPATWRNWMRHAAESVKSPATRGQVEPDWRRQQREHAEGFLGPAAASARRSEEQPQSAEVIDVAARRLG